MAKAQSQINVHEQKKVKLRVMTQNIRIISLPVALFTVNFILKK